nr:HNH endonuclease domain-containing protein [uncultured Flavobacterium sp.]
MRKQTKHNNSLAKDIEYTKGGDNSILREILFKEQKGFCSYTETYLGRTDQKDIDHFNPSQNYSERNSYLNLFLCKSQWNKEKSNKWTDFQPALSPLNDDFEDRISYNKELKLFEAKDEEDNEAKHLVKLLKLDDYDLSVERKKYIELCQELIKYYESPTIYFEKITQKNLTELKFIRSLEIEFDIDIWNMIPELE